MASKAQQIVKRLQFGKEDLMHNRQGELSPKQKEILIRGGRNAGYLFLGIAVVLTPVMWFASRSIGEFAILELVVVGFCGLLMFGSRLITSQDAKAGVVESIVGRPSMKRQIKRGKLRNIFSIGDKEFSDMWLHKLLNENTQYRVYFAPKSSKIVSIEPYNPQ